MAFPYGVVKFLSDASVRIVIPKKICPKAVDRNRLRRRIRAIVRNAGPQDSGGVAIYPNKKAFTASFADLEQAFNMVLK